MPQDLAWSARNSDFTVERVVAGQSSRAFIEKSAIDWVDSRPPGSPTHRGRFVATRRKDVRIHAQVLVYTEQGASFAVVGWEIAPGWIPSNGGTIASAVAQWMSRLLQVVLPDSMRVAPPGLRPGEHGAAAGWLTYLSRSLGPLPSIPPPTQVVPVDDLGWILVAQPDPVDEAKPEHQASLAYVRHALGARVLRDGPAFPPPAVAEAVAAVVAMKELDPALAEVPSYLKAPPVVAELTPPPIRVAPAPGAAAPFVAVTVDIDLAQILKSSVPFDSEAAPPTLPVTAQPAGQSRVPTAGETKELDVFESVKRDPAVPFGGPAAGAAARGAATERPSTELPAAPQGKRWKLFDPQTGRPLAGPVLEAIPPAPRATPSGVPAETIGSPAVLAGATGMLGDRKPDGYTETLELDPALLAAVLKKPAAPFRR